jgi:hypothetical protein
MLYVISRTAARDCVMPLKHHKKSRANPAFDDIN